MQLTRSCVQSRLATTATAAALLASIGCAAEPETPAAPAAEVGSTLLASVGTEDDPESFEITLTTEDGENVQALAAGDYTITVTDYAMIHNFALSGPGVDEATSVPGVKETTFEVALEPGEYNYTCDPHPSMSGSFDVT